MMKFAINKNKSEDFIVNLPNAEIDNTVEPDIEEPSLHPPYILEYWKLRALFDNDPSFNIGEVDSENQSCTITVNDPQKAELFNNFSKLNFLTVNVEVDSSPKGEDGLARLFDTNPYFSCLYEIEAPSDGVNDMPTFKAVLFKPVCMSYYSDDFFSPTGHTAVLPQTLVKELFGKNVNINTDLAPEEDD